MADLTLYYFPGSYFSMKAYLALLEKNAVFKERIVNIHGGDQSAEWFLRINKNGEVPVLQIGDEYLSGSEDIVNRLDKIFPSTSRYVLDPGTQQGREMAEFRKTVMEIPIEVVSFGVFANRQFCHEPPNMPRLISWKFNRVGVDKHMSDQAILYESQLKSCPPELKAALERKKARVIERKRRCLDEKEVGAALESLNPIFDKMESFLVRSTRAHGPNALLFGPDVTAADISSVILMWRLNMLGMLPRYCSESVRPNVHKYYQRMTQRPAVLKTFTVALGAKNIHTKMLAKKVGKGLLKTGLLVALVGAGYLGYKKLKSGYTTS